MKVLAILFNCSEPEAITLALQRLHHHHHVKDDDDNDDNSNPKIIKRLDDCGIVLGAYANRLTPVVDATTWTLAESETAQAMRNDLSEKEYWDKFISTWIKQYNVKIVARNNRLKIHGDKENVGKATDFFDHFGDVFCLFSPAANCRLQPFQPGRCAG